MSSLELALRSMATLQWLCLGIALLWRGERSAAGLPLGLAAYLLTSAPGIEASIAGPWLAPFTLLCVASPVWFRLLAQGWFADSRRVGWHGALAMALLVAIGLWKEVAPGNAPPWTHAVYTAGAVVLVLATLLQVLRGKAGDLVEPRRRWRTWFVLAVGAYGLVAVALLAWHGGRLPAAWSQAHVGALLLASVLLTVTLAACGSISAQRGAPAASPSRPAPPVDAALVERIREAMEVQHLYRQDGLTVAALASAIGSQEYLVRRAINGHLGCRNFNEFLNRWRLGDAASRLRSQPRRPILSIALDVGYGSVGPFNRAFRARYGMTPSEYRSR